MNKLVTKKPPKTILDALQNLIDHKETADIKFNIVKKASVIDTIWAHKFILSVRSAVFAAMIHGDWADKETVLIKDISANVFRKFIGYLYTDNDIDLSKESEHFAAELMYAAHKYEITQLEQLISDYVCRKITELNVLNYYITYNLFNNSPIVDKCMDTISNHTLSIVKSNAFSELSIELIKNVLQLSRFSCGECVLFGVLMAWSMEQCRKLNLPINSENKRMVLNGAHELIRFPTMTMQEFFNIIVMEPEFFQPIEIGEIFMAIQGQNVSPIYSNVSRHDSSRLSNMLLKLVDTLRNI